MMWIDRIEFHECRFSSCGGHRQVLSGSVDSAPIFHLGPRHHTGASFALMYNIFKHQYNLYPIFFNTFSLKVIFIKMRQNHNFETWRIEGECFQESLIIPLNSTSSHSHLRQR